MLQLTHHSHGIEDLLEKDHDGLDAPFLLQLNGSNLCKPLRDLFRVKACGRITAQFIENLLARQAVWRLGQKLVGLARDMFSQDMGVEAVLAHDYVMISNGDG